MTLAPTSPERLLDAGTDYERQLLAASDGFVPSAAAAARVAAALRSAAAGAAVAPRAAQPANPTAAARLLKPGLGIVGGGMLAALVASQWPAQPEAPRSTRPAATAAPAPEPASAPGVAPLPDALPLEADEKLKTEPRATVKRRPAPVSKPPAPRAQLAATDLAAEVRAIEHVQSLLGWGQTDQAAAALRRYRTSFPHGELALEAELLEVDVALARGDLAHARALARELSERPGASRYRARLSSLLEASAAAPANLGSNRPAR